MTVEIGQVWEDTQAASFGVPRPVTLAVVRELHPEWGEVWVAMPGQDPGESQSIPLDGFEAAYVLLEGTEADYVSPDQQSDAGGA